MGLNHDLNDTASLMLTQTANKNVGMQDLFEEKNTWRHRSTFFLETHYIIEFSLLTGRAGFLMDILRQKF